MKPSKADLQQYLTEEHRKRIGNMLKAIRRQDMLKLSQKEMADILHVERQHINKIENGKICPSAEELIVYSQLFNCPVDMLLYGIAETIHVNEQGMVMCEYIADKK